MPAEGQAAWERVDAYFDEALGTADDEVLVAALERAREAGLPDWGVSPSQGRLLELLVRMSGATELLEIGTLAGYSTIWMARGAGPEGHVVTLERDERYAALARENLRAAGFADRVDVVVGDARESLRHLEDRVAAGGTTVDFVFIDADKRANADYLRAVLPLCHEGSVIVADNVVRNGRVVADETERDDSAEGVRRFVDELAGRRQTITATVVQTVGGKGWDGFVLARVGSPR